MQGTVRIPAFGENGVERSGVVRAAVADNELDLVRLLAEVHDQVAGLLGGPLSDRMRGDTEDVHPAGGDVDDEQYVEPAQSDGVDVEEVGREQPAGPEPEGRCARSCPPPAVPDRPGGR